MFGSFILSGGKMWSFVMFHPLAGVKCNKSNTIKKAKSNKSNTIKKVKFLKFPA